MSTTEFKPTQLKCEYRSNPLSVDMESPRLSWILESETRGRKQSAYQLLVADSEQDLQEDKGTLWDSGKIASDQSLHVDYEGKELRSGVRYYWKVRVWDEGNIASAYSEPAMWGTGFLQESDWAASWIGLGRGAISNHAPSEGEELEEDLRFLGPSPYLRKTFEVDRPVRQATLYATARGVYELRLNGTKVGKDVLCPGWTDYEKRIQYQTHDVTEMLARGQNTIGSILSDGWFSGYFGMDPKRRGAHYGSRPQLLLQLSVEYEDETSQILVSDGSWRSSVGPIVFSDLLMGEFYDARREMEDWDRPGFDDSGWHLVTTQEGLGQARLVAESSQPVRVNEKIQTKSA